MSTTTAPPISELDIATLLETVKDEPPPCEHSGHQLRPRLHDGPAVYIVRVSRCSCGRPPCTRKFCARVVERALYLRCSICGAEGDTGGVWTVMGKI